VPASWPLLNRLFDLPSLRTRCSIMIQATQYQLTSSRELCPIEGWRYMLSGSPVSGLDAVFHVRAAGDDPGSGPQFFERFNVTGGGAKSFLYDLRGDAGASAERVGEASKTCKSEALSSLLFYAISRHPGLRRNDIQSLSLLTPPKSWARPL
jgi:hypothetical protein